MVVVVNALLTRLDIFFALQQRYGSDRFVHSTRRLKIDSNERQWELQSALHIGMCESPEDLELRLGTERKLRE